MVTQNGLAQKIDVELVTLLLQSLQGARQLLVARVNNEVANQFFQRPPCNRHHDRGKKGREKPTHLDQHREDRGKECGRPQREFAEAFRSD